MGEEGRPTDFAECLHPPDSALSVVRLAHFPLDSDSLEVEGSASERDSLAAPFQAAAVVAPDLASRLEVGGQPAYPPALLEVGLPFRFSQEAPSELADQLSS